MQVLRLRRAFLSLALLGALGLLAAPLDAGRGAERESSTTTTAERTAST